jgi:hypothetical protein
MSPPGLDKGTDAFFMENRHGKVTSGAFHKAAERKPEWLVWSS